MQTSHKDKPLRIKKVLNQRDVRWGAVLDLLCSRYKLPFVSADQIMRRFVKRLDLIFNATWFLGRQLNINETKLVLAICEVHGADSIVLTRDKRITAGSIRIGYEQRVLLEPQLGKGRDALAACTAEIDIRFFGKSLRIRSLRQVMATQALLFLAAVLSYVIFVGAFLKGFATFLLLTQDPAGVTMAVTRRFDLMLGLLFFLVGVAGIFGGTIRYTGKLAWSKLSFGRGHLGSEAPR